MNRLRRLLQALGAPGVVGLVEGTTGWFGAQSANVAVGVLGGTPDATVFFIHTDHLNTPRLVANSSGTTVWKWDQQEPFGVNVADEDPDANTVAFEFPLRFPGQYTDKETNLFYNAMRDYSAGEGRYVQSDPIGLKGGLNTFLYAGGNPLVSTDPLGLASGDPNCGCKQSFADCFEKCATERLGDLQTVAQNLIALGAANSVALTRYAIPGTSITGPALQVLSGLGGRALGGALGGPVGRGIGGGIGAFGGRVALYALVTAGAATAGYVLGSLGYCSVVCTSDHCYY